MHDFILKESESFFYSVFLNSMVGQVIVDENLNIALANNRMFEYFDVEPYNTNGLPFGRAFFCKELGRNCYECGKSIIENFKDCGIINAMRDIQDGKTIISDSVIQYSFHYRNHLKIKWFQINGCNIAYNNKTCTELIFSDVTELKLRENQLREWLSLDLATGAMNKHSLLNAIQKLTESERSGSRHSIISMVDFDNFKLLNDHHGHLLGDKVLEKFSDIARKYIRKDDMLGRFGGEEFVFIFNDTDEQQSLKILKRIHKELEAYFNKKFRIKVTFSAGVITVDDKDFIPLPCTVLLGKADRMLYQAKARGRGRAMSSKGETLFASSDIYSKEHD